MASSVRDFWFATSVWLRVDSAMMTLQHFYYLLKRYFDIMSFILCYLFLQEYSTVLLSNMDSQFPFDLIHSSCCYHFIKLNYWKLFCWVLESSKELTLLLLYPAWTWKNYCWKRTCNEEHMYYKLNWWLDTCIIHYEADLIYVLAIFHWHHWHNGVDLTLHNNWRLLGTAWDGNLKFLKVFKSYRSCAYAL